MNGEPGDWIAAIIVVVLLVAAAIVLVVGLVRAVL